MGSTGTYEETLPCGGKLSVTQKSWTIEYYFPGPDLRYSGDFVRIAGAEVAEYIQAFEQNFADLQALKAAIPAGGEFTKAGLKGMQLRVGGYHKGVCLRSYHLPIDTHDRLQEVVEGYRYAIQRAPQIQQFLDNL